MGRLSEALLADQPFEGATFNHARDHSRLSGQLLAVYRVMLDCNWHSLADLAFSCAGSEAGVSARLRDLRKLGLTIERKHIERGLWRYRLVA